MMKRIQFKWDGDYQGLKGLILFSIIIATFHLLYKQFEAEIISIPLVSRIIGFLVQNLLISCLSILHIFNISTTISNDIITLPNGIQIQMQYGCSGFQQFLLIAILFILFPGPWKKKLWFIPSAILLVHILNIIRFVGISIYAIHFKEHFHFVHDWIFRPFIYFAIFMAWVIWVDLINRKGKNKKPELS